MGRAGYCDDIDDDLALGRWRGAVRSALRGRRGQAFLKEALAVLDAMPDKKLIVGELIVDGNQGMYADPQYGDEILIIGADELVDRRGNVKPMGSVCLLGAIGKCRGIDMSNLDPHDIETVGPAFGVADAMAREIVFMNDEAGPLNETPAQRWTRMRAWVAAQIVEPV